MIAGMNGPDQPQFGHSLMEDIAQAQRGWNEFVAYALDEADKGNRDPIRQVYAIATERVMERMEERAKRGER